METKRISSILTKPFVLILMFGWILFLPILLIINPPESINIVSILGFVIWIILAGIACNMIYYIAVVKVSVDGISFKKLFRPEKKFNFQEIHHVYSTSLRRAKFTSVMMKDSKKSTRKISRLQH